MANEKRLIYANAAEEIIRHETDVCNSGFTRNVLEFVGVKIGAIPTVDAVEVVHGRWKKYQRYVICPNCDAGWPYYKNDTDRFRYCPNCGAKMDGGNEG